MPTAMKSEGEFVFSLGDTKLDPVHQETSLDDIGLIKKEII
ncbi:hypothetical protein [Shewanella surugensis]|nr:hypothetical protein [Shewanella surugensis]